jgi:hypothetical protein
LNKLEHGEKRFLKKNTRNLPQTAMSYHIFKFLKISKKIKIFAKNRLFWIFFVCPFWEFSEDKNLSGFKFLED